LEKNRRWRRYEERENKKRLENKKPEYEVEDCHGNGNGNGNILLLSLYNQVQVRSCLSNDKISAKGIERKKLGEKGKCKFCQRKGIIVEKFHRLGYSTKSSCALRMN
jgi:hypothetical protein